MTLKGIDISSSQKNLNCENIDADFVIIKATQGTSYVNPYCDIHYQQAMRAGQLRGVYHFANGGNAIDEANFFLNNIQGYIKDAILALDWEKDLGGGYKNPVFGTVGARAWVKTWCDHVYHITGVRPVVYVQQSSMHDLDGIGDYGLWIAQYANYDPTGYQEHPWNEDAYTCAIRQYSSHGRIYGYDGDVDLDIAYMDDIAWNKYANPNGVSTAPVVHPVPPSVQPVHPVSNEISVGDTVRPNSLKDYNGNSLTSYHNTYTVSELNGDRAVLTVNGQVWAAMNVNNISKVGGTSAPSLSINVGDRVHVTNAVTYTGQSFKTWYDTYTVMELKGDRAVIGVNGTVTAAINVNNLSKV